MSAPSPLSAKDVLQGLNAIKKASPGFDIFKGVKTKNTAAAITKLINDKDFTGALNKIDDHKTYAAEKHKKEYNDTLPSFGAHIGSVITMAAGDALKNTAKNMGNNTNRLTNLYMPGLDPKYPLPGPPNNFFTSITKAGAEALGNSLETVSQTLTGEQAAADRKTTGQKRIDKNYDEKSTEIAENFKNITELLTNSKDYKEYLEVRDTAKQKTLDQLRPKWLEGTNIDFTDLPNTFKNTKKVLEALNDKDTQNSLLNTMHNLFYGSEVDKLIAKNKKDGKIPAEPRARFHLNKPEEQEKIRNLFASNIADLVKNVQTEFDANMNAAPAA